MDLAKVKAKKNTSKSTHSGFGGAKTWGTGFMGGSCLPPATHDRHEAQVVEHSPSNPKALSFGWPSTTATHPKRATTNKHKYNTSLFSFPDIFSILRKYDTEQCFKQLVIVIYKALKIPCSFSANSDLKQVPPPPDFSLQVCLVLNFGAELGCGEKFFSGISTN
jgi:hypothetical protein